MNNSLYLKEPNMSSDHITSQTEVMEQQPEPKKFIIKDTRA